MKPKFKIMKDAAQAILLAMMTIAFTFSASADEVSDWAVLAYTSSGASVPARPPLLDTAYNNFGPS